MSNTGKNVFLELISFIIIALVDAEIVDVEVRGEASLLDII